LWGSFAYVRLPSWLSSAAIQLECGIVHGDLKGVQSGFPQRWVKLSPTVLIAQFIRQLVNDEDLLAQAGEKALHSLAIM
jgi:hypothetical protein